MDAIMEKDQIININGVQHNAADLSKDAREQLMGLRLTDQEIARTKNILSILQTARLAYGKALSDAIGVSGDVDNTNDDDLTFTF
ncbi:MAG: Arc/MetJ family transcription regulator [Paraglaciecola psychrophila]|jgi:Arc/MetJ family transcription regulator